MKKFFSIVSAFLFLATFCQDMRAAPSQKNPACPRPAIGSKVEDPDDLRSQNGTLEVDLTAYNAPAANGSTDYCFTDAAGRESPTLRVSPGDLVVLHLRNKMTEQAQGKGATSTAPMQMPMNAAANGCTSGMMVRCPPTSIFTD